jgi:4-amino-4-deoxy-L-arabinose transferase-like glycosyltransferase
VKNADRAARILLLIATAWLIFAALWGFAGIPGGGHLGAGSTGTFMAGEQMIRWKILYPARSWYTGIRPEGAALMCHHPYGQYYVPALLFLLFGHHDFLIHLPAVALSAAIPPLLYGVARERWGSPLGAVAAAAYVVVPIAVGFSSYWNLESICIFGSLLFFWGHSRHMTTGRRRYLGASLAGLCVVCAGDWVGYLLVTPTLIWAFARAFVLPARMTPRFRLAPYARWWATAVVIMAASLLWWIGLFAHADQIQQWLGAEDSRGGGQIATISEALQSRQAWIDFSFTPLAITLAKIAAPLCVVRLLLVRRDEETYALGLLFGGTVQYVAFKRGADVHIYWPHYFAAYFALALAELAGTVGMGIGWLARRIRAGRTDRGKVAALVGLAVGLLPVVAMAHDGVASLWVWRRTGGRYDEHGSLIRSHVDLLYVIEEVILPQTRRGTPIDAHRSAQWGWEFQWKAQAVGNAVDTPAVGAADVANHPFWIARASGLTGDEQRRIASAAHVRIYGDAWVVDQRERPAPVDAYALNEREPNPWEWLVYGGTEPVRSLGPAPDPWLTWEWRIHLGQPASVPVGEPATLDEMRIAHNVAVAGSDTDSAQRWQKAIEAALDRSVATGYTGGIELVGVRVLDGVEPRVESWFEVSGGQPLGEASFNVRSTIEARNPLSLIPPDPTDREMAFPPRLPTKLWRPGFLYTSDAVLDHRIGRERYWGRWRPRDGSVAPQRLDGRPETTLALLR